MTIQARVWDELSSEQRARIMARSQLNVEAVLPSVKDVVERVRTGGDAALVELTAEFDKVTIDAANIAVSEAEFDAAPAKLSATVRAALDYAIDNVERFHAAQVMHATAMVEVRPGVLAGERLTPIDSVGLYVPCGRGSFPSMLYMLAVPARLAGVGAIALATPPLADGSVDPAVLYAAQRCGVHRVYRVGGAQAVAALAYGTETVSPVCKIIGPGSVYVAAAKRVVADLVDTGLPAGPSESIVLADESADPWRVALDLMVEAEHGSDSAALLVTTSQRLAERVVHDIAVLLKEVPAQRRAFLADVFNGYGGIVLAHDSEQALEIVNEFAPEHLLLHTSDPYGTLAGIRNAGEILIGPHSTFSLANYAAGANAVLPTGGWARSYSPVAVRDFQKVSSVVHITETGYRAMRDHVIALADYEGFFTHAAALRRRK